MAPAAPAAVFQTASFCAQPSHLRALDPPRIGSRELGGYSEPILAAENPGRPILAAEKPWVGYLGCGKTWAGAILAAENRAHVHILEFVYTDFVFLVHRKPSEELFCEVRGNLQRSCFVRSDCPSGLVLGPGIWRLPVRFPASRRSARDHFFVTCSSILGCLGMCLGEFGDAFG